MIDCDSEMEFLVEELEDGTLSAFSMGACIHTEADDRDELLAAIKEAVCCHFDEGCSPRQVRLRFVRVVREELVVL